MTRLGIRECPSCLAWKSPEEFSDNAKQCVYCAEGGSEQAQTTLVRAIAAELHKLTTTQAHNWKIAEYLVQAGVKDV